jgi:hypothetical protein
MRLVSAGTIGSHTHSLVLDRNFDLLVRILAVFFTEKITIKPKKENGIPRAG